VLAALAAGCGGGPQRAQLTVSAAASLKGAFEGYANSFRPARVRYSFGGSGELAAQIRQGVRPDLYAAANTQLPEELFHEGLVEKPVTFARNRLVIAVPASSSRVKSLADLAKSGIKLVVGAPSVPVGSYTREALDRLPGGERSRILANVRSKEPDVASIVGKLAEGGGDAGFVYFTDVLGTKGRLGAIDLPRQLRPEIAYAIAVVTSSRQVRHARQFVAGLLRGAGRRALLDAAFEPPKR
jgi:molybdate transport system substrate-binding protein